MKNNILSNIQWGITAAAVAGTACCSFAGASNLTQTNVFDGLTDVADDANKLGPYGSYYITEGMVEQVKTDTGFTNVDASGYYSLIQTIENQDMFDNIRSSDLVSVKTLEGHKEMRGYTATNLATTANAYVAGEMTFGYTFNDRAHYDTFISDYQNDGIVFQLPGIGYLAADTKIFIDISFENSDGSITQWEGGPFLVGTVTTGSTLSGTKVEMNAVYIPEPSTATLSLLSLAGLLARRRRKIV